MTKSTFQKLTPEQLRTHKGVSFTGITTVFLCHDGNGKILLGKRGKNARDEHGRWEPGAGGLKHGQAVEDNLRRELLEEYGVEPEKIEFIDFWDAFRENDQGLPTHWLALAFVVKVNPSKVRNNEPENTDEIGWFSPDNLPSPMHSQFQAFYERSGEKLRHMIGA